METIINEFVLLLLSAFMTIILLAFGYLAVVLGKESYDRWREVKRLGSTYVRKGNADRLKKTRRRRTH